MNIFKTVFRSYQWPWKLVASLYFYFFLVVWTFVNNKMKTPDCWKKLTSNILVSIFFVLQTILSWNPLTFTFRYYVLKFVSALVHIFDTHVKLIWFQFILQYLVIHKKDLFSYLIDFSYFPEVEAHYEQIKNVLFF